VGMAVWHATESPLGLVLLLAGPPMALPAVRLVQLRRTRGS